jgi:hypothetical protein
MAPRVNVLLRPSQVADVPEPDISMTEQSALVGSEYWSLDPWSCRAQLGRLRLSTTGRARIVLNVICAFGGHPRARWGVKLAIVTYALPEILRLPIDLRRNRMSCPRETQ